MSRLLRIVPILLTLAAILAVTLPYVGARVATSAVINAPIVSVKAPFEGEIGTPSAPGATDLPRGSELFGLAAVLPPEEALIELDSRRAALRARRDAVAEHARFTRGLESELRHRHQTYQDHRAAWTEGRIAQEAARLGSLSRRSALLQEKRERYARMRAQGTVPQSDLAEVEMEAEAVDGDLAESVARLSRLRTEFEALGDGLALDGPAADELYALQRLDTLRLERQHLKSELGALEGELAALDAEHARHVDRIARQRSFVPKAPARSVVWRPSPPEGERVIKGEEVMQIINCEARFLEVTLPERAFERVAPGDPADIRLHGSERWITAPVTALRGAGAMHADPTALVVVRRETVQYQMHATIDIGRALDTPAGRHCDVGRTAEVRLPRLATRGGGAPSRAGILGRLRDAAADAVATRWRSLREHFSQRSAGTPAQSEAAADAAGPLR